MEAARHATHAVPQQNKAAPKSTSGGEAAEAVVKGGRPEPQRTISEDSALAGRGSSPQAPGLSDAVGGDDTAGGATSAGLGEHPAVDDLSREPPVLPVAVLSPGEESQAAVAGADDAGTGIDDGGVSDYLDLVVEAVARLRGTVLPRAR